MESQVLRLESKAVYATSRSLPGTCSYRSAGGVLWSSTSPVEAAPDGGHEGRGIRHQSSLISRT